MTVVSSTKDTEARSFTIVSDLAAPPARVWQIWSDPRQLERWWGPPTWPATFEDHKLVEGENVSYYMTGPDGSKARGWWVITAVDEPRSIEFDDGFSDDAGQPNHEMPTIKVRVELEEIAAGTRMSIHSSFATVADMDKLVTMGMIEGMTEALGQIDALLTAGSGGR
jgi:uncharacterized protein YndB with AHSA1/START domain